MPVRPAHDHAKLNGIAASRLPNTVAHFAVTIEREKALGIDHWNTG